MSNQLSLHDHAFRQYRRKQIAELRPWVEGEDMAGVSVAQVDRDAGSPKPGDMIARNPKNHADKWLVAAAYFADNFEELVPMVDSSHDSSWLTEMEQRAVARGQTIKR